MTATPCKVVDCVAFASGPDGLCVTHRVAKRAGHVDVGVKCACCGRSLSPDDWVTLDSTFDRMAHAVCPERTKALPRKKDRAKPLLAEIERGENVDADT